MSPEFLKCLCEYMGRRRCSTATILGIFNVADKSEQREAFRASWVAFGLGPPTLKIIEQVLKSSIGTIVQTAAGPYSIRPVPVRLEAGKCAWMFDLPDTGMVPFLRELRMQFAGRELLGCEAYALLEVNSRLDDLALGAWLRKYDPLSKGEFAALLRACKMHRVDGFVLTKKRTKYWVFVELEK